MAAGKVQIRDRDRGYRKTMRTLNELGKGPGVKVGVFGTEGRQAHQGGGNVTLLDVAFWAEFGTETAPQRSWLREWFDEQKPSNRRKIKRLAKRVVAGKMTEKQALELLGTELVGSIRDRISRGIAPPNAPSTVAQKRSSTPLIRSGQFQQGITHEVDR